TSAVGIQNSYPVLNRLQEQLSYVYDAAGNLRYRTNNALVETFGLNSLNELTNIARSGTMTVCGTTTGPATNVTVNGLAAEIYGHNTFAKAGFPLADGTNTFTAIAADSYGRSDTNTSISYIPVTNWFSYDGNGNMLSDGVRVFEWDFENQLTNVYVTNAWRSEFQYDGLGRRRRHIEYVWLSNRWSVLSEVRYVYDGL